MKPWLIAVAAVLVPLYLKWFVSTPQERRTWLASLGDRKK